MEYWWKDTGGRKTRSTVRKLFTVMRCPPQISDALSLELTHVSAVREERLAGMQCTGIRESPYRAVNTLRLCYKTSQLMLYREIMAVCSEIHTKHINTVCGQNVELLNVKLAVHIVTTGL